ncbi:nuclease-related domain-containing protein [Undibacterium arcticum]|uniref:Nuclease-related domain-containing protein n=1 Tax=Undibacterium arcticum TaxID=1762892 RepID=A0ABV7EYE6_9BURK
MLIKRLTPTHTYLQYGDDHAHDAAGKALRMANNDRTRIAMQATCNVAAELDSVFASRPDVAVLHDVRIRTEDGKLHIDHLFITHNFHVFIVESRTAGQTLGISDQKQFTLTDPLGSAYAIPSPLRQLMRNRALLKRLLRQLDLPKRFGRTLQPSFHHYLLIDPQAEVQNQSDIDFRLFVSPSQLIALIDQQAGSRSLFGFLQRMPSQQLRQTSRRIAQIHAPKGVRFSSKFRHVAAAEQPVPRSVLGNTPR